MRAARDGGPARSGVAGGTLKRSLFPRARDVNGDVPGTTTPESPMLVAGQILMVLTLVLMVSGKTPLYTTAIVGSTIAALVAGIPITGDAEVTVQGLVIGGLNPVIADMAGVLLFIGAMEYSGYLQVIINWIVRSGSRIGGGAGVATAGGIAAGGIGAFTGFTQPAITAAITGPASVRLGADPNQSAGTHAHAGHIGNFAGFTHPTNLAVLATTGLAFGLFNVYALIVGLSIFALSFFRMRSAIRKKDVQLSEAEKADAVAEFRRKPGDPREITALLPFLLLVVGFAIGYPVFVVGAVVSVLVMIMSRKGPAAVELAMLTSVERVAVPLIATVGFLYMSGVLRSVGITDYLADWFNPLLDVAPVLTMFVVAGLAGLLTQSNSASLAIVLPFLEVVVTHDVRMMGLALVAAGAPAIMQYFLTGGPVAALATTIPVVPGSDLKTANRFQRPSQLVGMAVLAVLGVALGGL